MYFGESEGRLVLREGNTQETEPPEMNPEFLFDREECQRIEGKRIPGPLRMQFAYSYVKGFSETTPGRETW